MTDFPSYRADIEALANDLKIRLYQRFTEAESADILGISIPTLRRIRARGAIGFLKITDRHVRYFGFQLCQYLVEQIEEAECPDTRRKENFRSESTGYQNSRAAQPGAEHGSMQKPGKQDELLWAQKVFAEQKSD